MFEDRIYEIKEITYDRLELLDFYNSVKHLALDYSESRENAISGLFTSVTLAGDDYENQEFHDFPVIKNIMDMFNPVVKTLESGNLALAIYQPGFQFQPHTDFSRNAVIMFPILPEDGGVGIDFYSEEILGENAHLVHTDQQANAPGHDDEFYLGTCQYSTIHPTLMDCGKRVHGVRNDNRIRVYLQVSMYDKFEDIVKMIKSGKFLNIK
jgi:hypothetical protein